MAAALELTDVTKRYRLTQQTGSPLWHRLRHRGRLETEEFWALRGVSFEVEQGTTVALLGHNGSGKSTLLSCVAGTMRPTSGSIIARGRVSALLELGAGFHPELTGKENIYLNGSILGFTRADIDARFDAIVDFAGIGGAFIDNQVRNYSSGMYARLGFAVAVNVDPDILLVDEVLAVGDEAFQEKCLDRIAEFQREGRTILVVTHAPDQARKMADRVIVLDHGRKVAEGNPTMAVRAFRDTLRGDEGGESGTNPDGSTRTTGLMRVDNVDLHPCGPGGTIESGDPLQIQVAYHADVEIPDAVIELLIHDDEGTCVLGTDTARLGAQLAPGPGPGNVTIRLASVPLLDGSYTITLRVADGDRKRLHDALDDVEMFRVRSPSHDKGLVDFRPAATVGAGSVTTLRSSTAGPRWEPGIT